MEDTYVKERRVGVEFTRCYFDLAQKSIWTGWSSQSANGEVASTVTSHTSCISLNPTSSKFNFCRENHFNGYCQVLSSSQNLEVNLMGTKDANNSPTNFCPFLPIKGGNKAKLILVKNKMEHRVVDPTNNNTHCYMS